MSFLIRHTQERGLDLINIEDESSGTVISLLPGFGAALHAFAVRRPDGATFNVIDNYSDLAELKRDMARSFKGPKLSPFPCRIRDGVYQFEGTTYHFTRLFGDGTAIHGLIFDKPFSVLEEATSDHSGTVVLEYSYKKDDPGYPFDYDCQVRYLLHPDSVLEVVTSVTNLGKTVMPIADGWHPYFKLGGRIDDWRLQFHSAAILEFDSQLIPTGKFSQYDVFQTPRLIGDVFLDNCFSLKPDLVSAACEIYHPGNGITISFFPDASYPYLQIYTPATRTSIAVENLSGAPDCFNNKMGLTILPPGHSQIFTVRYKVSVQ
ncbi:MAG TPA: aldose 1-epimerase [Puia sp.]|jgi:aldose 1-epimerase|nr:aldose 1-epimerase [Puia sp.]